MTKTTLENTINRFLKGAKNTDNKAVARNMYWCAYGARELAIENAIANCESIKELNNRWNNEWEPEFIKVMY